MTTYNINQTPGGPDDPREKPDFEPGRGSWQPPPPREPAEHDRGFIFGAILLVLALAALIVAGVDWFRIGDTQDSVAALEKRILDQGHRIAALEANAQAAPVAATKPSEPTLAKRLELGLVKKGNGDETPFIRQLKAEPELVTDPKEKFDGDVADKAALTWWAGREAHIIAEKVGYFDAKTRLAWTYFYPDTVSLLLQKDVNGKLSVAEYVKDPADQDFGASPSPAATRTVAPSISQAQFMGWPDVLQDHPLPSYEHLHIELATGDYLVQ